MNATTADHQLLIDDGGMIRWPADAVAQAVTDWDGHRVESLDRAAAWLAEQAVYVSPGGHTSNASQSNSAEALRGSERLIVNIGTGRTPWRDPSPW